MKITKINSSVVCILYFQKKERLPATHMKLSPLPIIITKTQPPLQRQVVIKKVVVNRVEVHLVSALESWPHVIHRDSA